MDILTLYIKHGSLSATGAVLGISKDRVRRKLQKNHLREYRVIAKRRRRGPFPLAERTKRVWSEKRRRAFFYYMIVRSTRQVGREFGVSAQRVGQWFREMHPDYVRLSRSGVFASTGDWLRRKHSERKRDEIAQWVIANLPELIADEAASSVASMTVEQEWLRSRGDRRRASGNRKYVDSLEGVYIPGVPTAFLPESDVCL